MRSLSMAALMILACALCISAPAKADDISTGLGNFNSVGFIAGNTYTSGTFTTLNGTYAAPFNSVCGSDTGLLGANCSASWTFNYTVPAGDTITGATLTLGIVDIDSAASGNQVGSFTLDGTDDLTALLNAVSEGLNGGSGAPNNQYDILTINIPGADLTSLSGDTATFAVTLAAPGLGTLGNTPFNGAGLVFSTLDITAMSGSTPPPPTPEPSTTAFLMLGLAMLATTTALRKHA